MKMDHPPLMKEDTPSHRIHPEHMEQHFGGDGHKQHHEHFKAHSAGHKLHHEHIKAMCMGGKTK